MHSSTTNLMTPSISTTATTATGALNVPTSELASFSLPSSLYANPTDRPYSAYVPGCTVNGGDQLVLPPMAHGAAKDLSTKLSVPQTVDSLESHRPYYSQPGLCPYIPSTPWSTTMNPTTAGVDIPWSTINKPVGLISSPSFMLGAPGLSSLNPVVVSVYSMHSCHQHSVCFVGYFLLAATAPALWQTQCETYQIACIVEQMFNFVFLNSYFGFPKYLCSAMTKVVTWEKRIEKVRMAGAKRNEEIVWILGHHFFDHVIDEFCEVQPDVRVNWFSSCYYKLAITGRCKTILAACVT